MSVLTLTPEMCEGRSGQQLLDTLNRYLAPNHIIFTHIEVIRGVMHLSYTLVIYYRDKSVHAGRTDRFYDDNYLTCKSQSLSKDFSFDMNHLEAKIALL